jgi:hypothetical protein
MYGFGELGGRAYRGVLADVVRVPFADAMLIRAPEGVPSELLASAGDNVSDGYRSVAKPLLDRPGAPVLVVGGLASSVGLYAVACAKALGSGDVRYLDHDESRLAIARRLGARALRGPYRTVREPGGFPVTVDASATAEGLAAAMLSTSPGGTCTSVGIYYEARTPVPLLGAFGIGLTFVTGRVDSRAVVPEVLALLASEKLDIGPVTSQRVDPTDVGAKCLKPRFLEPDPRAVAAHGFGAQLLRSWGSSNGPVRVTVTRPSRDTFDTTSKWASKPEHSVPKKAKASGSVRTREHTLMPVGSDTVLVSRGGPYSTSWASPRVSTGASSAARSARVDTTRTSSPIVTT